MGAPLDFPSIVHYPPPEASRTCSRGRGPGNDSAVNSEEFFDRERDLARRFGVRKLDVMLQTLRCDGCDGEALRINRFAGFAFGSLADVEREMIKAIGETIEARCESCDATSFSGQGATHLFLLYTEAQESHLAVRLRLSPDDTGRTKVVRQVWWMPLDGTTEEIESAADPRLDAIWVESALRGAITNPELPDTVAAVRAVAAEHGDAPLVWEVLGETLIAEGRHAEALGPLERSLELGSERPQVMRRLGLLYTGYGDGARGARWLQRAFEATDDGELLGDLMRAAYRGRALGALEQAAREARRREPDTVAAWKALVCCGSAVELDDWRDAWRGLRAAAARAGERYTEAVAAWWSDVLDVPWPAWPADADRESYRRLLVRELVALDFDVDDAPAPAVLGDAELCVDLAFTDWSGRRFIVLLRECLAVPHVQQTLRATALAVDEDPSRHEAALVLLPKQPASWASLRHVSRTADALLDLCADADTTMHVNDENAASFMAAAERHFGRTLDLSPESLDDVDAIVLRYFDDGFGDMGYALQCQVAAYVGEVVSQLAPDVQWRDGSEGMDPRVLSVGDGEMNVVSKVGKMVANGPEDSIAHFVRVVLGLIDEAS